MQQFRPCSSYSIKQVVIKVVFGNLVTLNQTPFHAILNNWISHPKINPILFFVPAHHHYHHQLSAYYELYAFTQSILQVFHSPSAKSITFCILQVNLVSQLHEQKNPTTLSSSLILLALRSVSSRSEKHIPAQQTRWDFYITHFAILSHRTSTSRARDASPYT